MPPLVGVGVKVTLVPAQMVVAVGETATEGVTDGFTVMVTGEEVAVLGDAQLSLEVISTVTTSPSLNAALEYDALFVPAGEPLTYH